MVAVVTESWLVCHEFDPSAAEDPLCRGNRCTLNLLRHKRPPIGVKVSRESQHNFRSRCLTTVQSYETRHQ
ncbi:hypothetical protein TNCV_4749621 [Trichonephila clavipes]|nr:hypothetical protein TNCV_4749621 [Trichonephila clavipes]